MRRTPSRNDANISEPEQAPDRVLSRPSPVDKINLPTDLLRTFVAVYELSSFTKAAHLFELTQPAVSAHMKKLELLIGGDLIEKNVSGVKLTERGVEVLKYARRILSINDQIATAGGRQHSLKTIRLGIPNIFAAVRLREISQDCPGKAGKARLQIVSDHSPSLVRGIAAGYLDIALVMAQRGEMKNALRSWTEEMVWVRAPDFVVDGAAPVPLISSSDVLLPDRLAMEALDKANMRYEVVFTAFDTLVRRAGAAAGLGCFPLPRSLVPDTLVIELSGILPAVAHATMGIIARDDLETDSLVPLIDAVERICTRAMTS